MEKVASDAIKWMDWSGGDGETYRIEARIDLGYDPYDAPDEAEEEIEKRAEEIAKEQLVDSLYNILWQYEQFQDPIRLFRKIRVKGESYEEIIKNIRLLHVGEFWSHDENAAEAHWGDFSNGTQEVTLYAEIPQTSVNWYNTLIKNIIPSYAEEQEIEINLGTQVPIQGIKIENDAWRDVEFYAYA